MQRVVSFYEKLPRGPAPKFQPKGLMERYAHRYFWGDNASKARMSFILLRNIDGVFWS